MNTNTSLNNAEASNHNTAATATPPPAPSSAAPIRNPKFEIRNHPKKPNRSRSNIARLPHQVREMLNYALREGMDYREIILRVEHLAGKFHGVTPNNLSAWFRTGYAEWLRQKTHLEDTIAQNDALLTRLARLKSETGADLHDLLENFFAALLQKTLQDFDPASLNTLLAEKPVEVFRFINCLNSHITARAQHKKAEVARVRCQIEVAEKAEAAREDPVPAKNLYESQMISKSFGTPSEQFTSLLARHVPAEKPPAHPPNTRNRPAQSQLI